MSDLDHKLRLATRRLVRRKVLCAASRALAVGLAAALALIVAHKLFDLGSSLYLIAATLALLAALSGAAWALARRPHTLHTALLLDRRLGLDERLASAVCAAADPRPMAAALRADAAARLNRDAIDRAIPAEMPRAARWLPVLVAAAVLAAALLPAFNLRTRGDRRLHREDGVRRQVAALRRWASAFAQQAARDGDLNAERFARELQKLLKSTETRAGVIRALQAARADAEKIRKQMPAPDHVPQPTLDPARMTALADLAAAMKANDFGRAAEGAAAVAGALSAGMAADDLARLRSDLLHLGDDPGMGRALGATLRRAADAIAQRNVAAAAKAMAEASESLAAAARAAEPWQRMDNAMKELGRALAMLGERVPPDSGGVASGGGDLVAAAGQLARLGRLPAAGGTAPKVRTLIETERVEAARAMRRPEIPFAYRDAVKRYFQSVDRLLEEEP